MDAGGLGAAGHAAHDAEGEAAQHEQAAQRDDEGWQAGPDHDEAVEVADDAADQECQQHGGPQGPAPDDGRDGDDDAGKTDHGADRQVELAGDHQQRHGCRKDTELRRHFEKVDDALGAEDAAATGGDGEECEDQKSACNRAQFRAAQEPAECRDRPDAFIADCCGHALFLPQFTSWRPDGAIDPAASFAQRLPCLASSMTDAAVSLVTKPGPVG